MEKVSASLLDKAVETGLNVALVGEAGVGKEWAARLLHKRRNTASFWEYDCLKEVSGRWSLVARFIKELDERLLDFPITIGIHFLKDLHYLDKKQIAFLLDHLQGKLLENHKFSSVILRAGLVCSCEPEMAKDSPWQEFITQFFPHEVTIPPLRQRRADIPSLVAEFISEWMRVNQKVISGIEAQALSLLENYNWPGNISELKSVLRQAYALTENFGTISADLIEKRMMNRSRITA